MALPVYRAVLVKYQQVHEVGQDAMVRELLWEARKIHDSMGNCPAWGFKLPESILILDMLLAAFPNARFLHMVRDPLGSTLRRTHKTARLDSAIGRVAVAAAYRQRGIPVRQALTDNPAVRMAYTTMHQLELALDFLDCLPSERVLQVRFEDIVAGPDRVKQVAVDWLGIPFDPIDNQLSQVVSPGRAEKSSDLYEKSTVLQVGKILEPLRERLGYH